MSSPRARPQNGHALYGIARSHVAEGDEEAARLAFETLLEAWAGADADRSEVVAARAFLNGAEAASSR